MGKLGRKEVETKPTRQWGIGDLAQHENKTGLQDIIIKNDL